MQDRISKQKDMGRRIRTYREAIPLRAVEVAAFLGVSRQYYYDIEIGRKGLTIPRLEKLALILHVDMNVLVSGAERKPRPELVTTPTGEV